MDSEVWSLESEVWSLESGFWNLEFGVWIPESPEPGFLSLDSGF